jgi:hypothetical protein
MTNNERIEAYFRNELGETEQQHLLQDVKTDKSLNSDFKFQESVTDGIKAFRKKELIAKLDNIQIATTSQSLLLKTIGIVGIATIATIGTYMWLNQDIGTIPTQPESNIEELVQEPTEGSSNNSNSLAASANEDESSEKEDLASIEENSKEVAKLEETITPERNAPTTAETVAPTIVVPEFNEPESGESMTDEEDLSAPDAMSTSSVKLSTRNDVEVKLSKKYTFHYQIVDEALVLYGSFNESPFEVIELKTNEGINSYLYFKENFYSLLTDSKEIRPLYQIENKELINELQKRR